MKTVLVTGGMGTLGHHVTTTPVKNGHTARIMSRAPQRSGTRCQLHRHLLRCLSYLLEKVEDEKRTSELYDLD